MTPREEIGYGLDALVIFRSLQQDPVLRALMQFCHTDKENTPAQIRFYSAMVSALYERADDLTGYLEQIVLEHENVYVQRAGAGETISQNMETCLHTELKLLNRIAMLTPGQALHPACSGDLQARLRHLCTAPHVHRRSKRRVGSGAVS